MTLLTLHARQWAAIARVQSAHLVMLREAGLIDGAALASCLTGVGIANEGTPPVQVKTVALLRDFDERAAALTAPAAAGVSRVGRGDLDVVATVQRIVLRSAQMSLEASVNGLRSTILDLALMHVLTLMPVFIDGQVAQPTTLGHLLGAFAARLGRASKRLKSATATTNQCPMGANSLASSGMPIDRERVAQLLGFDGLMINTLDAVSATDHFADCAMAMISFNSGLIGLLDLVLEWSRVEPASIRFSDEWLQSITELPQIRIPAGVVRLRDELRAIQRECATVVAMCNSGTLQPGINVADAPFTIAVGAIDATLDAADRFRTLISEGMVFNRAILANRAGKGFSTGSDLADFLMLEEGIDPDSARSIATLAISRTRDQGLEASGLTPEIIDGAALLVIGREIKAEFEVISRYLAPRRFIERRTATGAPSPASTRAFLEEERDHVASDKAGLARFVEQIEGAATDLDSIKAHAFE